MRYFSTKTGALCTRYGTGTYIGASVSVVDGATKIAYDEEEIASITDQEIALYGREYAGLILEGSLIERSEEDYVAWQKAVVEAVTKEAEAAATLATAAAKKTETTTAPPQSGADPKAES